jgi:chromate reductase
MEEPMKIFGIAGSLRKDSYNRAALRAAQQLAPEGVKIEIWDRVGELPLFSQDLEKTPPPVVTEMKAAIRATDAVLFVTPEYNYSVSGVLKNAIDWASRPYGDSAWSGKPVAIMSASGGIFGGARAQYHLRQMFVFLNMYTVNQPEVMIPQAHQRFDEQGNLTDENSKKLIRQLLEELARLTRLHVSEAIERKTA